MAEKRLINDKCIAKRLYAAGTPYIQVLGYVGMVSGAVWWAFNFGVSQTQAFTDLSKTVQQQHDDFLTIKQEVHDIHELLFRGRH